MRPSLQILRVVLLCATVFQLSATTTPDTEPSFCKEYDCPKFTVVSRHDGYDLRKYEGGSTWIGTSASWNPFAHVTVYGRLNRYINGNNEAGSKFKRTLPVVTNNINTQYTMWWYLGTGEYPKPSDKDVKLVKLKDVKVYARDLFCKKIACDEYANAYNLTKEIILATRKGSNTYLV